MRPLFLRIRDGGRIGEVGTELLERGLLRRLMKIGTQGLHSAHSTFLGGLGEQVTELSAGQDNSLDGFHEADDFH